MNMAFSMLPVIGIAALVILAAVLLFAHLRS